MRPLLEVRSLTKRYGGLTANSNVVFDVNEGEIVGIIGPNGAGKSTLFDLILYGILILLVCMWRPSGILSLLEERIRRRTEMP